MRLATEADFFGNIYTHYRHHEGYAKRASLFKRFPEPILTLGCGFGFLVAELIKLGKETYGIDASEWAIENRVTDCVVFGNAMEMLPYARTVISEDLLPYLTDEEVLKVTKSCNDSGAIVVHLVTESGEADLNYHSLA